MSVRGKGAGGAASVVGPSLGASSAGGADLGLLCSCCFSTPGSGVQHHLYTDFWCSDEPAFSVPEVLIWQQTGHKARSTPSGS